MEARHGCWLAGLTVAVGGLALTAAALWIWPTVSRSAEEEVIAAAPRAGPFGLKAGMSLAELRRIGRLQSSPNAPGEYRLSTVPKPHADFAEYRAAVSRTSGLCGILAFGKPFTTDSHGDTVRDRFDSMVADLEAVYGDGFLIDTLAPGSFWTAPGSFTIGMMKGERDLMVAWQASEVELPHRLALIGLTAEALGVNEARLTIGYSFDNHERCEAEARATDRDAL